MSVFKPFLTSDVIVSPFKVNKSFTFKENEFTDLNVQIDRFLGKNITSSLWVSGSNNTGYITTQNQFLVYHSIKELYYSNYLEGSNIAPTSMAIFNNDGTITGSAYTPNYYNYLSNTLSFNRFFPTGSNSEIGVISIPSNLFGEYINPGTFKILSSSLNIYDDGLGNLLWDSNENITKIGDIIYEHGLIVSTILPNFLYGTYYGTSSYGTGSYDSFNIPNFAHLLYSSSLTCSFESTVTIYETQYKCTIKANEFNFSNNPSLTLGSSSLNNGSGSFFPQPGSGKLNDNVTGSYFSPYITTVGLYNNNKELLAVAKLAQPLPVSSVTDTSILINFDF